MMSSGARDFSIQKASAVLRRPETDPRICWYEGIVAAYSEKAMRDSCGWVRGRRFLVSAWLGNIVSSIEPGGGLDSPDRRPFATLARQWGTHRPVALPDLRL